MMLVTLFFESVVMSNIEGKNMFTMLAPDPVKVKEYMKANPDKKDEVLEPMKEENDSDE